MSSEDKLLPQKLYLPTVLPKEERLQRVYIPFLPKAEKPKRLQRCSLCNELGHNKRGCKLLTTTTIKVIKPSKPSENQSSLLPPFNSWEFELIWAAKEYFDWNILERKE